MSRDKLIEIEKITDVLDKCTYDNELKDEMALMLYTAGYRKSTDVAEEIFAEIEKAFTVKYPMCTNPVLVLDSLTFAELKKKYTEGN